MIIFVNLSVKVLLNWNSSRAVNVCLTYRIRLLFQQKNHSKFNSGKLFSLINAVQDES